MVQKKIISILILFSYLMTSCGLSRMVSGLKETKIEIDEPEIPIFQHDLDMDGVPDLLDWCPDVFGSPLNHGCELKDDDHDGVYNEWDKCPETEPDTPVFPENGCPTDIFFATYSVGFLRPGDTEVSQGFRYNTTVAYSHGAALKLVNERAAEAMADCNEQFKDTENKCVLLPLDETSSPNAKPDVLCLNTHCDLENPKDLDGYGKRLDLDFGNTPGSKGDEGGSHPTGDEGGSHPTGDEGGSHPTGDEGGSHPTGDEGGSHPTGDEGGSHPSGDEGGSHPSGDEGGSHPSGDEGGSSNSGGIKPNPGNSGGTEGHPTSPSAPQPSVPVKDRTPSTPTNTGGGTSVNNGGSEDPDVIAQTLKNFDLKTDPKSELGHRLFKVADSLQKMFGLNTPQLNSPSARVIFNDFGSYATFSLGLADDSYVKNEESVGNAFLYLSSLFVEAAYDLATSDFAKELVTSVGPAGEIRSLYELLSGKSLITGEPLSPLERSFALLGVATGGVGAKIFRTLTIAEKIEGIGAMMQRVLKKGSRAEEYFEEGVKKAKVIEEKFQESNFLDIGDLEDRLWMKADGKLDYPLFDGFDGPYFEETLKPGYVFDRYGKNSGVYVSPLGTPFPERALANRALKDPYRQYEVVKEIAKVKSGKIAPFYGKPGGGTQHILPASVDQLLRDEIIREIK